MIPCNKRKRQKKHLNWCTQKTEKATQCAPQHSYSARSYGAPHVWQGEFCLKPYNRARVVHEWVL